MNRNLTLAIKDCEAALAEVQRIQAERDAAVNAAWEAFDPDMRDAVAAYADASHVVRCLSEKEA